MMMSKMVVIYLAGSIVEIVFCSLDKIRSEYRIYNFERCPDLC